MYFCIVNLAQSLFKKNFLEGAGTIRWQAKGYSARVVRGHRYGVSLVGCSVQCDFFCVCGFFWSKFLAEGKEVQSLVRGHRYGVSLVGVKRDPGYRVTSCPCPQVRGETRVTV